MAFRKALEMDPESQVATERLRGVLEDKLERRLFELGYLSRINKPIRDFTPYENRTLIKSKASLCRRSSWRSAANKVAVYFFDTSALLKRYVDEPGSTWVRQVTDPKSGNKIYITTITGVEVISAIMKNVRSTNSSLVLTEAQRAIADFRNDFGNQYAPFPVTDSLVERAMGLPEKHKLRGYDAVQLSAALIISAQSKQQGIPATGVPSLVLVASDDDLLAAAQAEGLAVDDPRDHP